MARESGLRFAFAVNHAFFPILTDDEKFGRRREVYSTTIPVSAENDRGRCFTVQPISLA